MVWFSLTIPKQFIFKVMNKIRLPEFDKFILNRSGLCVIQKHFISDVAVGSVEDLVEHHHRKLICTYMIGTLNCTFRTFSLIYFNSRIVAG